MLMIGEGQTEMGTFYDICIGLTLGVLIGFGAGGLKMGIWQQIIFRRTSDSH